MRRSLLFVLLITFGGCSRNADSSHSTKSMSALPENIRREVASTPSLCLVVTDFDNQLSLIKHDSAGHLEPGFLSVSVKGRPDEERLFPGVDSFAVSTPYVVIGCKKSADVPKIVKQAFIDAQKYRVSVKVWAKIDGRWELQT